MRKDYSLADALVSVKTAISDYQSCKSKPDAGTVFEEKKAVVKAKVNEALTETEGLQSFSALDFSRLMQLCIFEVGFAKKGVTNLWTLSALSDAVPSQLGIETFFPSVDEEGKPSIWYYTDVMEKIPRQARWVGNDPVYVLQKRYGEYALRLSGIFSALLKKSEKAGHFLGSGSKKNLVDIEYYEFYGSIALHSAAQRPIVDGTPTSRALEDLANDFSFHRQLLSDAVDLMTSPAAATQFDLMLRRYGLVIAKGYSPHPLQEKRLKDRMDTAGLQFSRDNAPPTVSNN